MAYIGTLPRKTTSLENISKSLADALDALTEIKRIKGEQMISDAMTKAMIPQQNETANARTSRILNTINQTKMGAVPKKIFGVPVLDRALGMFNPNQPIFAGQSSIEKMIMSEALQDLYTSPYRTAQTQSLSALAQQRRRAGERETKAARIDVLKTKYERYKSIAENIGEREGRRQYARDKMVDIERELDSLTRMMPTEQKLSLPAPSMPAVKKPMNTWSGDNVLDESGNVKAEVQIDDIMYHNGRRFRYLGNNEWSEE